MTAAGFLRLAWQTLVAPRDVAKLLLSLRLGHEALLTALALVVVLNALVVGLIQASGLPGAALPVMISPGVIAALLAAMLTASILFMTWLGRILGGQGRAEDIALLLIWLQALRALGQIAVALAAAVSGALASLLVIAALIAGIWIMINFLDVAHGFDSLGKALLLLVLGSVALVFALSFVFTLLGVTPNGMSI
ncbi:YIP1 family protein [Salipiger abyssi]|uniref:YIP1 family protein n=1 Tax=Salipiger abyssi TaxID=1250539 RepID=UPI004058F697